MKHYKGDELTCVAFGPATFRGRQYNEGDHLTIELARYWDEHEGLGEGGPWGWGGYTAELLERITLPPEDDHSEVEAPDRCVAHGFKLPCRICHLAQRAIE